MKAVSTANAPHYTWGQQCDGWHLLQGFDLSVIEERMPPGTAEVRHRHVRARQFFYVLEGVAHRLAAREGLHVPPGAAHQMRNEADGELRFIVVSSPKSHGDRETVDG